MTTPERRNALVEEIRQEFPDSKHGAVVLHAHRSWWVECLCGWVGPATSMGAGSAAIRWAQHVAEAARTKPKGQER